MASYTTNLNLEMPTVNEKYDVLKQNANWQKVDDYAGTVNEQIATLNTTQRNYGSEYATGGSVYIYKSGNVITLKFGINGVTANATVNLLQLPNDCKPWVDFDFKEAFTGKRFFVTADGYIKFEEALSNQNLRGSFTYVAKG